jgi:hypothetical protein
MLHHPCAVKTAAACSGAIDYRARLFTRAQEGDLLELLGAVDAPAGPALSIVE